MATAAPILNIQSSDNDLAKQTVFIKLHLGLLGNSRKVSSSQVALDADKALIRVSKTLLDRRRCKPSALSMATSVISCTTCACPSRSAFTSCRWAWWRRWMRGCTSSRINEASWWSRF